MRCITLTEQKSFRVKLNRKELEKGQGGEGFKILETNFFIKLYDEGDEVQTEYKGKDDGRIKLPVKKRRSLHRCHIWDAESYYTFICVTWL